MQRVLVAVGVLVVWLGITFLLIPVPVGDVSLDDLVTQGLGRQFVIACLFLVVVAVVLRWGDLGFGPPRPGWSVILIWLHLVGVSLMVAIAASVGFPPTSVVLFVLANTLMVGFSEEVMFRGFLLSAMRGVMGVWPAVLLSSVIFGAVHAANGFVTGAWDAAWMQAAMAGMSGLAFAAIRVRTGSLWPGIVAHGLWDFGLFVMSQSQGPAAEGAPEPSPFLPLLFVAPFVIYAIWLLRRQSSGREAVAAG
jgi:hypothetical protein